MNSDNKKSARVRATPQPFKRNGGSAVQPKPVVARPKGTMPAPGVKRPVAPPVYKPQPRPAVAQSKTVVRSAETSVSAQSGRRPIAPPAFRPLAKSASVQAKMGGSTPLRKHPAAPPVYHPPSIPKAIQAKNTAGPPASPRLDDRGAAQRIRVVEKIAPGAAHRSAPVRIFRPGTPERDRLAAAPTIQTKTTGMLQRPSSNSTPQTPHGSRPAYSPGKTTNATSAVQRPRQARSMVVQRSQMSAQEALKYSKESAKEMESAKQDASKEKEQAQESEVKRSAVLGQKSMQSCGLAAVRMVVYSKLEYEVTEKEMAEWLKIHPTFLGTTTEDLTSLLRSFYIPDVMTMTDAVLSVPTRKLLKAKIGRGPIICGITGHWIVIDSIDVTPGRVLNQKLGLYAPDEYTFIGRDPWGFGQSFPPKGAAFEFSVDQMRALGASEYIYFK